jgi:CBS domain-containing protein
MTETSHLSEDGLLAFLRSVHPYDSLDDTALADLARRFEQRDLAAGTQIYALDQPLDGLYLIHSGEVEVRDAHDAPVSLLGPRNSFGERGLLRDGKAVTSAKAVRDSHLLVLGQADFQALIADNAAARRFFDRTGRQRRDSDDLGTSRVSTLMAGEPVTCTADTSVREAARLMAERRISSLCVVDGGKLAGIVTVRDLTNKVVARDLSNDTAVREVMTADPLHLSPRAIGSDVLHAMQERGIGHVPIVEDGQLLGIVTQTDLMRFQALSSATLVREVATADSAADMIPTTARIPDLLAQLVNLGHRHETVTRLITDIADAATRRLLTLAERELGPPPARYLWLACGSQGRQEQTGVSDQDNCLMLDDSVQEADYPYFDKLARFVSDGLHMIGYVYCPGDMMATNPRWRQPVSVWRGYFRDWIDTPNPEAQMLASVMFDLRPIGGAFELFEGLHGETLKRASKNSIFVAHMASNALKHTPPLGLLRGFATIRSGDHKKRLDLKHSGVVPVVDLARIYALQGRLKPVNTRARLEAAAEARLISQQGSGDLLAAYDTIAETRLRHQARRVEQGEAPDNYMAPEELPHLERSHLRDAFVVVKGLQSSLGHGRSVG